MKDTLTLLASVVGVAIITFSALQGGWWMVGIPVGAVVCWTGAARTIRAEAREARQGNGELL